MWLVSLFYCYCPAAEICPRTASSSPLKLPAVQVMERIIPSNILLIVRTSALLGILFHASINGIEFELYMFHFLAVYAIAFIGYTSTLALIAGQSFLPALAQTSLAFISFNISTILSIAIYRLFFHRCRKFKGPLPAKLTRFYATYLNGRNRQYSKELGNFHQHYGDVVRTGTSTFFSGCDLRVTICQDLAKLAYSIKLPSLSSTAQVRNAEKRHGTDRAVTMTEKCLST